MASDLERVFGALEAAGARYLVVGGVAVVLHGHPRFTADLEQGADWERTKGLPVFSLWSADLPGTEVDLFASDPLPFEPAWGRRLRAQVGGLSVNVASLGDLIEMKRRAGRPRDLEDVRELEAIARELGDRRHD